MTVTFYSKEQFDTCAKFAKVLTLDGARLKYSQQRSTSIHVTLHSASGVERRLVVDAKGQITRDRLCNPRASEEVQGIVNHFQNCLKASQTAREHMIERMQNEG